ncbi:hypothetical protein MP638_002362 [Amoeboaphelidium occidentale]|nr:hypothetical protein MP638_002362 [Amoeboaphelidium occidentale]
MSCAVLECAFIIRNCPPEGIFNYLAFVYCSFNKGLATFALFLFLIFLFVFIGTAASDYFSPNVASLAKILRLPPDVAGVTLLALGNASGDLISNIVSIPVTGSASLAVSGFLGAGMITTLFVVGCIGIMAAQSGRPILQLSKLPVIRDSVFYLATLGVILSIILAQQIYWFHSVITLLIYFFYVLTIIATNNPRIMGMFRNFYKSVSGPKRRRSTPIMNDIINEESQDEPVTFPSIYVENPEGEIEMKYSPSRPQTLSDTSIEENEIVPTPIPTDAEDHHKKSPVLKVITNNHLLDPSSTVLKQDHRRRARSADEFRGDSTQKDLNTWASKRELKASRSVGSYVSSSSSRAPSFRSLRRRRNDQSSSRSDEIKDNVINLSLHEAINEKLRVGSISSALQLWDAVHGTKSPSTINDTQQRNQSDEEDVQISSSTDAINNILFGYEADDYPAQNAETSENDEFLTVLDKADYCPTCFKTCRHEGDENNQWDVFVSHCFSIYRLWEIQSIFGRFISMINLIPTILLSLSVPVCALLDSVDSEETRPSQDSNRNVSNRIPDSNSCPYGKLLMVYFRHRYIIAFQVLAFPFLICFGLNLLSSSLASGFYVWMLCLIIGVLGSAMVLLCNYSGKRLVRVKLVSKRNNAVCSIDDCLYCLPYKSGEQFTKLKWRFWEYVSFLPALSVLGFVSGGFWIFIISREVISVLETIGFVLGISDSILGLTFLAIGNSIGDLVTNIMVARLGFYSMAIAACFGAPLLNSLFTIGISGLAFENLKSSNGDSVLGIPFNVITLISCIALICATLSNLLILGLRNNFELRLSYSICLVICVCLIIGVNITIEVAKQL